MEFLQHLVQSLRSGRAVTLPQDKESAFYILMPMVIGNQHDSVADLLNVSDFDVNFACGHSQRDLLQIAANCGATDCLLLLLKRGARVNAKDISGCTSLHLAARNGHRSCLSKLLEYNADVNIRNNEGLTALHWLAVNGRTELLRDTLTHITSIDVEDAQGQTALHVASQNGHLSTVICLLDCGANINKTDHLGSTPLHFACSHGQRDTVRLLLQRNAQFLPDNNGVTPLELCIQGGYGETCETLLQHDLGFFDQVIQNVTKLHVQESKLHNIFSYLCCHGDSYPDVLLSGLTELASHTGHQLLSPSSDLKNQTKCLLRCMHLLRDLNRQTEPHQLCLDSSAVFSTHKRSKIFKLMENLWNSLEEWLILLKSEIQLPHHGNSSLDDVSSEMEQPLNGQDVSSNVSSDVSSNVSSTCYFASNRHDIQEESVDADCTSFILPLEDSVVKSRVSGRGYQGAGGNGSSTDHQSLEKKSQNSSAGKMDEIMLTTMAPRIIVIIDSFYLWCSGLNPPKVASPYFVDFVGRHEEVLQFLAKRNPEKIFDHFHFLLDCPELMSRFLPIILAQPFEARLSWFYENLHQVTSLEAELIHQTNDEEATLLISRANCFQSSCDQVLGKTPEQLLKNISVRFEGEDGMGHGLLKEWFDVLSREILNPDYALFTQSADGSTFQPNSNSSINPDHLNYFRFAGEVMGLALYHRQLLGIYFTRSFYKHILGIPVSYMDVASVDPEYAKNLQWLLDNDITNNVLNVPFAVETDVFGKMEEVELKPSGKSIYVSEKNKEEYVKLAAELRTTRAIEPQIASFLLGFHSFIPPSLVKIFAVDELRVMLGGLPDVDLDDWINNTEYNGYVADDDQVQWFWTFVHDMDTRGRIQLLQFATGCSHVPYGGFGSLIGSGGKQKFTIMKCDYRPKILPTASTCVNMLKLPEYPSKEELRDRMLVAISFGNYGYGLV